MNKLTKQEKKIVGWVNNNINELALLNESNLINRNNGKTMGIKPSEYKTIKENNGNFNNMSNEFIKSMFKFMKGDR